MTSLFPELPRCTPIGFPDLWSAWPRKVARIAAEKAYKAALKKPGVTPAFLVEQAVLYSTHVNNRDRSYVLHLATWLNGERWNDTLEAEGANGQHGLTAHDRRGDERIGRLRRMFTAPDGNPGEGV